MSGALDAAALMAAVQRHLGSGTAVADLQRLSGGASRELWAFDVVTAGEPPRPLVLRRDPPGSAGGMTGSGVDEYRLLQAAESAGVPVPPLRFRLEPDDGLGTGFVMDRVDGETLGKRLVHDEAYAEARTVLAAQCGRALARIHAIAVEDSGLRLPREGEHPALVQVSQFEQLLDAYDVARPAFEVALRWLRVHAPPSTRRSVVHGDFRVGNLIVGPEGLRAVLDWELAHVGDPAEDIGWCCVRSWRFGGAGRVGGLGSLADLLEAYRAEGGQVDEAHVRYWEVFGNLRWGIICLVQTFTHLQGIRRSVELAAIGRRVCEVEHDLMTLLTDGEAAA